MCVCACALALPPGPRNTCYPRVAPINRTLINSSEHAPTPARSGALRAEPERPEASANMCDVEMPSSCPLIKFPPSEWEIRRPGHRCRFLRVKRWCSWCWLWFIYSLRHAAGHQLEPALAGSLMIQYPAQSYLLVHWSCTFGWVSLLMFISRLFDHEMERIRIRGCLF